jgi:hypothetical protein
VTSARPPSRSAREQCTASLSSSWCPLRLPFHLQLSRAIFHCWLDNVCTTLCHTLTDGRGPRAPFTRLCSIEGALSYIVTNLSDLSQLAAQTDRLSSLLAALVAQAEGLAGGVRR